MDILDIQPTFKRNFAAGFDKYVKKSLQFNPPREDIYWNPRAGQWYDYARSKWTFVDENLPTVGQIDFQTSSDSVYDQITQQWSGLTGPQRNETIWDGRQHKWLLARSTGTTTGNGTARQEYEDKLELLKRLLREGDLTQDVYNKQAADLWDQYKNRI